MRLFLHIAGGVFRQGFELCLPAAILNHRLPLREVGGDGPRCIPVHSHCFDCAAVYTQTLKIDYHVLIRRQAWIVVGHVADAASVRIEIQTFTI